MIAVEYVVYDKDGDWSEVATAVAEAIETDIEVSIRYEELDVSSKTRMSAVDLSDTDLIIFSYIMSELAKLELSNRIIENFRSSLGQMKLGSKILFIDNLHPIFIRYFQSCKLVAGLNQRNDDDDSVICNFSQMTATFKELSQLLEWTPRTTLNSVSKLIVRTSL